MLTASVPTCGGQAGPSGLPGASSGSRKARACPTAQTQTEALGPQPAEAQSSPLMFNVPQAKPVVLNQGQFCHPGVIFAS